MIKYYTSSTYRKHYSDLQKLNLLSECLDLDPFSIGLYLLKNPKQKNTNTAKSPSKSEIKKSLSDDPQKSFNQLIQDLEVFKNITMTPIKAFKSLLLIHCTFLIIKNSPDETNTEKLNSYFKWILQETVNMIQKYSDKENKKRGSSIESKGRFFTKSQRSKRYQSPASNDNKKVNQRPKSTGKYSTDEVLSKEICLLSSIIKPYILYLQKILSIYSNYHMMMRSIPSTIQKSEDSAWMVLNIFKLMAPIIKVFVYIGRYFYKEYNQIVYLLIEFFSKQVNRLYPILRLQIQKKTQKIEHQWFSLLTHHSQYEIMHNNLIQIQGVDQAMLLVDQVLKINDVLFHIFYGKHFYSIIQRQKIPIPKWISLSSKQCEFLVHYVQTKKQKKNKKRQSKDKRASSNSSLNLPSQLSSKGSQNVSQNLAVKKIVLPKAKKTLKLDDSIKQDTITFRLKQQKETPVHTNYILDELSFHKQSSTEGSQNTQELVHKN